MKLGIALLIASVPCLLFSMLLMTTAGGDVLRDGVTVVGLGFFLTGVISVSLARTRLRLERAAPYAAMSRADIER